MSICPKCGFGDDWHNYLTKQPGNKVHFYSMQDGKVMRTRLHFKIGTPLDEIRAAMTLIAIEYKHDIYFRWCDTPDNTIDSVLERLI